MWRLLAPLLACTWALLPGCAAPPAGGSFRVEGGAYAAAFDGAKEELRAAGFELDRVDARAGVITTWPESSSGFATPWKRVETTSGQMLEGLLNHQLRTVRVVFEPVRAPAEGDAGAAGPERDMRLHAGPVAGSVTVALERVRRPGLRPSAASVRLTSSWTDPADPGPQAAAAPIGTDERLGARLAAGIAARAGVDAGGAGGAGADHSEH